MTCVLSLQDVSISRGEFVLCQAVNMTLKRGDICHVLGENGLGKTTLLMQIVGLLPTLTGRIDYLGQQTAAGAVFVAHQTGIHESLSVRQNLRFLLALYGLDVGDEKLEFALSMAGLTGLADVPARELSAGQSRRVGLSRLWLLTPEVSPLWVLDEPLTALDVAMVSRLSERIQAFAEAGGAVLLTSHQPMAIANQRLELAQFVGEATYDER